MSFDALLKELEGEVESMSKAMGEPGKKTDKDDDYEDIGDGYTRDGDEYTKMSGGCYKGGDGYYTKSDDGYAKMDGDVYSKSSEGAYAKMDCYNHADKMSKSFTIKLEDGEEIEAFDGAEMLKTMTASIDAQEGVLHKAMTSMVSGIKSMGARISAQAETISEQGELIKSLSETVEKIGGQPRGRKATLSVHDPEPGQKVEQEGLSPKEFMAKAQIAAVENKITWDDLALAETYINKALQPPAEILQKVTG